jgi:hypothetical protein
MEILFEYFFFFFPRLVTQVVSDHWLSYRNYRLDIVGDNMESFPTGANPALPHFNLKRLQVEFDQIFLIAAKRILSSHRYDSCLKKVNFLNFTGISLEIFTVIFF